MAALNVLVASNAAAQTWNYNAFNGKGVFTSHGYITLTDNAEVTYNVSTGYAPQSARGVRWNDPAFAIQWPMQPTIINARDNTYPDFDAARIAAR